MPCWSRAARVGPADAHAQPQPHRRRVVLQVGHVVVAGRERPAAARDPRTGLMGEHPVRVQAEMIMALPPRRRHRIGRIHHQRINTRPAQHPRRRQSGRPRPHHQHKLIHRASVDPHPATVKSTPRRRIREACPQMAAGPHAPSGDGIQARGWVLTPWLTTASGPGHRPQRLVRLPGARWRRRAAAWPADRFRPVHRMTG
jgi:hypothetical protein